MTPLMMGLHPFASEELPEEYYAPRSSAPPWRVAPTSSAALAFVSDMFAFAAGLSSCAVRSVPALPWARQE
eukprot:9076439-Pyramimonas_sp.AAC.1